VNDFKFGWEAVTERYPPGELLQYAIAAYEAGFDSIVWERAPAGGLRLDLAWGGGSENRKIMLGTGVTCPTLRYQPRHDRAGRRNVELPRSGTDFPRRRCR
jgi:hypothetical protein